MKTLLLFFPPENKLYIIEIIFIFIASHLPVYNGPKVAKKIKAAISSISIDELIFVFIPKK